MIVIIDGCELRNSFSTHLCAPQSADRSSSSAPSSSPSSSFSPFSLSSSTSLTSLLPSLFSYSPSSEWILSSAGCCPSSANSCPSSVRAGSAIWGHDGVGHSMAPIVLLTVDPAVRDARRGAAIVDRSPDLDFRKGPSQTSLCTCLPCLDERVLSTIARRCCDIVCR